MSWAEDNNIDCYDEDQDPIVKMENDWANGIHKTQKEVELSLKEMTTSHLVFTIRYFSKLADVSPLLDELKARKVPFTFENKELTITPYQGACLRCGEAAFEADQLCMKCLDLLKAKSIKIWKANTRPDRYSWPEHQLRALAKQFHLIKFIGIDFSKYE